MYFCSQILQRSSNKKIKMVGQQYRITGLCQMHSTLNSKGTVMAILAELLYSMNTFFKISAVERYTVRPEALDSEIDTALLIIDNILSYVSFMKIIIPTHHQKKINERIDSLKIKVTAMTRRLETKTTYHYNRIYNILAVLEELQTYPHFPTKFKYMVSHFIFF